MSTLLLVLFSIAIGWLITKKIGGNLIVNSVAFCFFWWMFGKMIIFLLLLIAVVIIVKSLKGK